MQVALIEFGFRRSLWILIPTALLTFFACLALRNLEFDVSSQSLTPPSHPDKLAHERVRMEFGSDMMAQVYAEDTQLFSREHLLTLRSINDALAELPFAQRVDSLFTLPDIRDEDGFLEISPLLDEIPDDQQAIDLKLQAGLQNELLERSVLSPDGTATVLNIYLDPEVINSRPIREIYEAIESLLEPHKSEFDQLFQLGKPALNTWLLSALGRDQRHILPAALALLFIILSFNQRSFLAGGIPILNGFIAGAMTFGIMSFYGIPVNLLNYILPALILVVGATEDMHILHEFRTQIRKGEPAETTIRNTAKSIWLALLLTAVTTILGFAATSLSSLPILQDFGIVAMIGMGIRFMVSVLVLPALLRVLYRFMNTGEESNLVSPTESERISRFILDKCVPHGMRVVGLLIIVALASILFFKDIRISNDLVSFLNKDAEIYNQMDRSAEKLAGSKVLFLTLYDREDSFYEPINLNRLAAITDYLRTIPEFDSVTSFANIVARINQQLRGGEPEDYKIPDSATAVRQMLFLAELEDFSSYISKDMGRANIVIRCNVHDSSRLNELVEEIDEEIASGRFGPQFFTITGEAMLVASAVDAIIQAQVLSLGGMSAILFIIIAGLFLSLRCGALTLLSNLFPITLIFGIMGAFGIPLNVGTCMVAAITLGIAIDDTVHLLVHFNRELKTTKKEYVAIKNALQHVMNPIMSTTLALSTGFLVLTFTSFEPVRQFGLLSAGVLMVALVTDFVVTPVLFANTRLVTLWDILGLSLRRKLLQESPLFQGFTSWQAKKLILASNIEEFPEGARVIREGDEADKMYLVLEGELDVTLGEDKDRVKIASMGVGEVIGEVAVVAREKRSADVFAVTTTKLLSLDTLSLERLQRFSPYLSSRLFLNLANIIGKRLIVRTKETTTPFPVRGQH